MSVTPQKANEIFENHPMRFTRKEKAALRSTLRAELGRLGYDDSEIREVKASGVNLVIGDPHAPYFLTAHYDTPGRTGWMFGTSRWLGHTGANFFLVAVMLLLLALTPAVLDGLLQDNDVTFWGAELVMFLMLAVMVVSMVIKNKNNRNDNTSGVLSLLSMAGKIADDPELRRQCCLVFFDNEEWGLLGSSGFAGYCKKQGIDLKRTQVLNFDCVGCGDILMLASTHPTSVCDALAESLRAEGETPVVKRSRMIFLSDHASFPDSVMISYARRASVGLLYLPLIHTARDTVCDVEQINRLTGSVYAFLRNRCGGAGVPGTDVPEESE